MDTVIAVDVGGTGLKCAIVTADGTVVHTERHATGRERGPDAVVATILDVAAGLAGKAENPRAVGIVVPGVVDEVNGVASFSSNIGWRDLPLRALTEDKTGLPTALGHDVRAGGLAEARRGAAQGAGSSLFMPVGTGIASAFVLADRVYPGAHGAAGEIGHIVIRPGGRPCLCGQRGCLETEASAAAVASRYAELTGRPATAAEVAERTRTGEKAAAEVWDATVNALADGLHTAVALYYPEVIVVGGGLAEAGDTLMRPLAAALDARRTFHGRPRLVRAALGDEAGCLGAALLALDRLGT